MFATRNPTPSNSLNCSDSGARAKSKKDAEARIAQAYPNRELQFLCVTNK